MEGALLLIPALAGLVLALNQASSWGLDSPALFATVAATILLLGWLVAHERRCASPLLAAVESGFVLLMGFAVLAAVLSARRGRAG